MIIVEFVTNVELKQSEKMEKKQINRNILLPVAVLLLVGMLVWILFFWETGNQALPQPGQPLALASATPGSDFTLT